MHNFLTTAQKMVNLLFIFEQQQFDQLEPQTKTEWLPESASLEKVKSGWASKAYKYVCAADKP